MTGRVGRPAGAVERHAGGDDIFCWAGIVLSGIFYWAMLPFRAALVGTHRSWGNC